MKNFLQNPWVTLFTLSTALLLISIDLTIMYTALPTLTRELQAGPMEKMWIMNAYTLMMTGLLPCTGPISDRFGHKRIFIGGLLVFGIASGAAALATGPGGLIAARAALGVGGAMMMPATLAIVNQTFPEPSRHATAISIWTAVASAGAAIGPLVGGVLLEHFWWGAIFLVHIPVVLIALPFALGMPQPRERARRLYPVNLGAAALAITGLVGAVLTIKMAAQPGVWLPALLAVALGSSLLLWYFVRWQRAHPSPLIDFHLFAHRPFAASIAAILITSMTMTGMELVFSQYLQLARDMPPASAALRLMPLMVTSLVAGLVAGRLIRWFSIRSLICTGLVLQAGGLTLMGQLTLASAHALQWSVALGLICIGAGCALTVNTACTAIMRSAPPDRAGMAASIQEISFEMGSVLGVTLFGSLVSFLFARSLQGDVLAMLPGGSLPVAASETLEGTLAVAQTLGVQGMALADSAKLAFEQAFHSALLATALLLLLASGWVFVSLKALAPSSAPVPR
ncbi:MAG: MFS transporter [Janthinobacterium lividum]